MQVQDSVGKIKNGDGSDSSVDDPNGLHEYVTWYQSITTVGIKTRAHSPVEAEFQANQTIQHSESAIPKDGFFVAGSGFFARTPLEKTQTEEI